MIEVPWVEAKRWAWPPPEAFSLPATTALFGFVAGSVVGSRERALRFTVENAHKKPKNAKGWYLYHREKQAKAIVAGVYRGVRYAAIFGGCMSIWRIAQHAVSQNLELPLPQHQMSTRVAQQALAGGSAGTLAGLLWTIGSTFFFSLMSDTPD